MADEPSEKQTPDPSLDQPASLSDQKNLADVGKPPAPPPPKSDSFLTPPPAPKLPDLPTVIPPVPPAAKHLGRLLKPLFGLLGGLILLVIIIVLTLRFVRHNKQANEPVPVSLIMWGIDEPAGPNRLIERYHAAHPNVTISYTQKSQDTYETEVNTAIAEARPPDIWQIKHDWIPHQLNKLSPAPSNLIGLQSIADDYPPIVGLDFIWPRPSLTIDQKALDATKLTTDQKLYAIPWSIDTLALIANQKRFAAAGLSTPPATWDEVIVDVKRLRSQTDGHLTVAGINLGTSQNIPHTPDILAALMLQNNAVMVSADGKSALFNQAVVTPDHPAGVPTGTLALDFYTSFAIPSRESYSWNRDLPTDLTLFMNGNLAMLLGYAKDVEALEATAPNLAFDVAALPQIRGSNSSLTVANYWANAVSKSSSQAAVAWDFLLSSASHDAMLDHWQLTHQPPARRDLITELSQTPLYGTFIRQTPEALSFYKGNDPTGLDTIFRNMIDAVVDKQQPIQISIDQAAKEATDLFQKGDTP